MLSAFKLPGSTKFRDILIAISYTNWAICEICLGHHDKNDVPLHAIRERGTNLISTPQISLAPASLWFKRVKFTKSIASLINLQTH